MWVLEEELLGAPAVSFPDSIPNGFCSQKLWGLIILAWNPGMGGMVWDGTPCSQDIPPKFLSTWVWDQPILCLCPSYQSGWMCLIP